MRYQRRPDYLLVWRAVYGVSGAGVSGEFLPPSLCTADSDLYVLVPSASAGSHGYQRICLPSTVRKHLQWQFHDGGGSFKPGDQLLLSACIERNHAASYLRRCAAAQM